MKKSYAKREVLWGLGSLVFLGFSYYLFRFALFDLHGMKQWPSFLAIAGLILILIGFAAKRSWLTVTPVLGYILGFVLGLLFNTDGVDAGGGRTNNLWIIWIVSFFFEVLIGFVADVIGRRKAFKQE